MRSTGGRVRPVQRRHFAQVARPAGVTFGLAMAAKFTAVILVPVLALLALVAGWRARRLGRRWSRWRRCLSSARSWCGACIALRLARSSRCRSTFPRPGFGMGLLRVKERDDEGRMAFLLGQMSPRGWWYYFPVAFAVKTPLPTLLLLGVAVIGGRRLAYRLASEETRRTRAGRGGPRWRCCSCRCCILPSA